MRLTIEEIRRVARLAHLEFDDREEARLLSSLEQILQYVEKLKGLDTEPAPPAPGAVGEGAALREDSPGEGLSTGDALSNGPETGQGHFKVPRVLPG